MSTSSTVSTPQDILKPIIDLSNEYGEGEDWVIAGGGNSSLKTDEHMWIKASGSTLRTLTPDRMVQMNRAALEAIWSATYDKDPDVREQQALADLMAAREDRQGELRPSVETMMHALFPQRLVLHTHPTMLNGLTCSRDGEAAVRRLLGDRAIWIPTVNPGYILSLRIRHEVESWRSRHHGAWPDILIMQNHGLVVAADTPEEIREIHREISALVDGEITVRPQMEPVGEGLASMEELRDTVTRSIAAYLAAQGQPLQPPETISFTLPELESRCTGSDAFRPLLGALTPDHIVYAGHRPCFVDIPAGTPAGAIHALVMEEITNYCHDEDVCPKIVVVGGAGAPVATAVAAGATERKARLSTLLFLNALQVCRYAESFGGVQPMPEDQVAFIRGWEVEKFREQASTT